MLDSTPIHNEPWNKGKLVGQKAPVQAQGDLGNSHLMAAF